MAVDAAIVCAGHHSRMGGSGGAFGTRLGHAVPSAIV